MNSKSMRTQIRELVVVWVGLLICLATTASVSWWPFHSLHGTFNLAISVVKTVLIGLFFMHLKASSQLARLIAVGGFLWLAWLMGLTYVDYTARHIVPLQ